jgi:hypothetical protein
VAKITKVKIDYTATIQNFIRSKDGIIDFDEVANLFTVAPTTVRTKIKQAMAIDKTLRGSVAGIFPDTETILNEVEARIGKIQGINLVQANLESRSLVDGWSKSFSEHFCRKALAGKLNTTTEQVTLSFNELRTELLIPYESYLVQSGNGLISIAGTLNQSLLVRALRNSGLNDEGNNPQFKETGNKSEGDIQIYYHGSKSHKTLSVEAKSYAARERLLRGLADIQIPKVGVGFFNDASEFNKDRVTLIATSAHASALYMPSNTFNDLSIEAKRVSHPETGRICRSLETEFVDDMKAFVNKGLITHR